MKSIVDSLPPIQKLNIIRNIIPENGNFPNNARLPLLLYHQVFPATESVDTMKEILESNSWSNFWVDSILEEHHYHSTAHEVLVALEGSARVEFGGPNGITLMFEKGDVVVIPAGVAHKKVDEGNGFRCLGAYSEGNDYDMNYGKPGERPISDENIRKVRLPKTDPLYGTNGPVTKNWLTERDQPQSVL